MKKRLTAVFLSLLLLIGVVPVWADAEDAVYLNIYVSPNGSDEGDGSENAPFKTLERARDEVRKHNRTMTGDIVVNLLPGRYERTETFELDPEDSGFNGFDVIWRGTDKTNMATISGATQIDGTWTMGEDGIWHVKAENIDFARELFVDGTPGIRARDTKKVFGIEPFMEDDPGREKQRELGFYIEKSKIGLYENPEDVEVRAAHEWKSAVAHIDDIIPDQTNPDRVIVLLDKDFWPRWSTYGGGTAMFNWRRGFLVENAYELLDEPGEFYYNKKTKILSYYPREGENLNTAEVLVPKIDRILTARGRWYQDIIKNIRFENIELAHTTNHYFELETYDTGQGEFPYWSLTPHRMGFAANLVEWSENIDFEACKFFGLAAMGLHLRDGVHNSEVTGCVFTDLGATGVALGKYGQTEIRKPKNPDSLGDVAYNSGWHASGQIFPGGDSTTGGGYDYNCLNVDRPDEENLTATGAGWYSRMAEAAPKGTKHFVKVFLDDDYTLETVKFSFPDDATAEEKSNFEILVSKNEAFDDPKVVLTVGKNNKADFVEAPVQDGEKYRYVMIRKTVADEHLAVNGVWAMSKDRGPKGNMGAPSDIIISNNYFQRVGQQLWNTYPIWLIYTKRVQVVNNEIYDAPYTGISIGWGWDNDNATTSGENIIAYNRIDNIVLQANDGAGIYIFGKQWGSEVRGNYISNVYNLYTGIYFDNGCSGVTGSDNISVNASSPWFQNSSTRQNVLTGMWADAGEYQFGDLKNSEIGFTAEPLKKFSYSNPPEEVVRIMARAGIEEEWEWIKERVGDFKNIFLWGPDAAESSNLMRETGGKAPKRVTSDVTIAKSMLDLGDFGYMPWQFSPESKAELEYWLERIDSSSDRTDDYSGGHIDEMYGLEKTIAEMNESVVHPSYEEMVSMCDEIATKGTSDKVWGGYDAAALNTFKKAVAKVKASNPQTDEEKAVAAVNLEKIYGVLADKCYKAEILGFEVEDCITEIDEKNKKITVYASNDLDRTKVEPKVTTNPTSQLAARVADIDFGAEKIVLPLYETNLGKYDYWTVEFAPVMGSEYKSKVSTLASDWVGGNPNSSFGIDGSGTVNIAHWYDAAMCSTAVGNSFEFSLNAPRGDAEQGIGMIFAAQTTDIEATGTAAKNAHYLLLLKNQTLELYKVDKGVRTLCATAKAVAFRYGEFNPFVVQIEEAGRFDRIKVFMDGGLVLDTLADEHIDHVGYFGIITKNVSVKIK